jgi:hypothetical protein
MRRVENAVRASDTSKPCDTSLVDTPHDRLQLRGIGGGRRVKDHAPLLVARQHAVQEDGVEVHIQVEAATESLDERQSATFHSIEPLALGAGAIGREDRLDEDAREGSENSGLECRESAELEGERQHELTHGDIWENAIDKMGGAIRHAPARTARADPAQLAREGDKQIVAA